LPLSKALGERKYHEGKLTVTIKFSRHAKRRANLYKIPETTVREILKDTNLADGEHEIVRYVTGFKYPIKIVVSVDGNNFTIITNYPLKKGRKQ
jgi:hypothetical protein